MRPRHQRLPRLAEADEHIKGLEHRGRIENEDRIGIQRLDHGAHRRLQGAHIAQLNIETLIRNRHEHMFAYG
jgi:hypothetical protein